MLAVHFKLVTNEGVLYAGSGPYTDATNDDQGVYDATIPAIRVNIGTGGSKAKSGADFGNASGGGTVTCRQSSLNFMDYIIYCCLQAY